MHKQTKVQRNKGKLVSRYFKPSQPQRIISGLRETSTERYIAEKTNNSEIGPEEQSEKRRVVERRYEMKYSSEGH